MEIIRRYFPDLSELQNKQYSQLEELYRDWNQKINVISRKDIDQLYLHHVVHSLGIAKFISFKSGSHILDVGTGGGFPGIPLAIRFPDTEFLLVDSIAKKIKVVRAVIDALQLRNCKALPIRAEQVKGEYDFVVSRAVTSLPRFIPWVQRRISGVQQNTISNGILSLKGGLLDEELDIPFKTNIISLSDYFSESFFETKKLIHVAMKSSGRQ